MEARKEGRRREGRKEGGREGERKGKKNRKYNSLSRDEATHLMRLSNGPNIESITQGFKNNYE